MEINAPKPVRVAIIGTGHVGATCAYALMLRGLVSEIVLINLNHDRAEGEAMDLNHSMQFARPVQVWAGTYEDCVGAHIVILAAGVAQEPGETRLDLLKRNTQVFQEIIPQIVRYSDDAILVVVTNPVDVLTHVAWKVSGFPVSHVIGSGTILDTARFRYLLSRHFQVEPRSVHAFIIGEHGDSQVPVWSLSNIAGIRLEDYGELNGNKLSDEAKQAIASDTRRAAYEIIQRKGATFYAIASGLVRIVEAIIRNENSVLTVSSLVQGAYSLGEVCISLPSVVNQKGLQKVLELPLMEDEQLALNNSAHVVRSAINSLEFQLA